jgi:hypothetical protein
MSTSNMRNILEKDEYEVGDSIWARPEMNVTFRAEIMPGLEREERTYRIKQVMSNGRVMLHDFAGEYRETAFEAINFLRQKTK